MDRPLPFSVLEMLQRSRRSGIYRLNFEYNVDRQSAAFSEACKVLVALGAAVDAQGATFDYGYETVLDQLLMTGCIPDTVAYQFYPTPVSVGQLAVEMADIQPGDLILEPSAGNGDLAALLPSSQTICVEVSDLRCSVLKSRGFNTIHADFLKWAPTATLVHKIVMNPPFSDGRALAHVTAAWELLQPGGRLVAVLPASQRGTVPVDSPSSVEWSKVFTGEFRGTSVSVSIVSLSKPM